MKQVSAVANRGRDPAQCLQSRSAQDPGSPRPWNVEDESTELVLAGFSSVHPLAVLSPHPKAEDARANPR